MPKDTADDSAKRHMAIDPAVMRLNAWYEGFTCKGCKTKIAVMEDWTSGMRPQHSPAPKDAKAALVACPNCHEEYEYRPGDKMTFCNGAPPKVEGF
jgi:hypothetical protein